MNTSHNISDHIKVQNSTVFKHLNYMKQVCDKNNTCRSIPCMSYNSTLSCFSIKRKKKINEFRHNRAPTGSILMIYVPSQRSQRLSKMSQLSHLVCHVDAQSYHPFNHPSQQHTIVMNDNINKSTNFSNCLTSRRPSRRSSFQIHVLKRKLVQQNPKLKKISLFFGQ